MGVRDISSNEMSLKAGLSPSLTFELEAVTLLNIFSMVAAVRNSSFCKSCASLSLDWWT